MTRTQSRESGEATGNTSAFQSVLAREAQRLPAEAREEFLRWVHRWVETALGDPGAIMPEEERKTSTNKWVRMAGYAESDPEYEALMLEHEEEDLRNSGIDQ